MLLTVDDLIAKDELLGPVLTEETLADAHEYLYYLASQVGVEKSKVQATVLVKRFITAYAFRATAVNKSFGLPGSMYSDGKDVDAYAKKVQIYSDEVKTLENRLQTAEALTGASQSSGFRAVKIFRG